MSFVYSEQIPLLREAIEQGQALYDKYLPMKSEMDKKTMSMFKKLERTLKEQRIQLKMMEETLAAMKEFGADDVEFG